jgi:hypothetical protein
MNPTPHAKMLMIPNMPEVNIPTRATIPLAFVALGFEVHPN